MATTSEAQTAEQSKKFELSIKSFCEVKNAVNAELEKFHLICAFIEEKINSLDPEIIQDLNELLINVQNSLDDGFSSLDLLGKGVTGLTSRVKQASAVWDKYKDQKTGTPFSGLVDDTNAVERRMLKLKENVDRVQKQFAAFEIEKKDSGLIERNATMPILGADQQKINKVTDEIGRRVGRDAKKLLSLQQRINVLKYATSKPSASTDDSLSISLNSNSIDNVDAITTEVRRLVLVADQPLSDKENVKDDLLNSIDTQSALQNVLSVHQRRPNAIRRIVPKRLTVDPKLVANTPVTTPQRRANADHTLGQQLAAAKNSPLLVRSPARPAVTKTVYGKSPIPPAPGKPGSTGTPVRVEAIMNAAKPTIQAAVAASTPPPPPPPVQVVPVDPQLPKDAVPPAPTADASSTVAENLVTTNATPQEPNSDKDEQKSEEEKSASEPKKVAEAEVSTNSQPAPTQTTVTTTTATTTVAPSSFTFAPSTDASQKSSFFNTSVSTQPNTQPTASSFSFASKPSETPKTEASAVTGPNSFSFASKTGSVFGGNSSFGSQNAPTGIFGQKTQSTTSSTIFGGGNAPVTTTTAPSQPSFSFAPKPAQSTSGANSFSFASQGSQPKPASFFNNTSVAAAKPSPIFGPTNTTTSNDDGMEDDSANAASSFSFGGTGLGGAPQNKPGSAFGSLNWATVGQNKPFGTFNQQPGTTTNTQPVAQPAAKPFGTSAFGSGPSFGGGSSFGGGPAFGSGTSSAFGGQKSMFGGGLQNSPAPASTGFSAFANKATSFGQLAQQSPQSGPSAFGSFGSPNPNSSFGGGSFGSPQNQSSAFTSFRK